MCGGGGDGEVLVVVLVQAEVEVSQSDSAKSASIYWTTYTYDSHQQRGGVVNAAFASGRNKEPLALTLRRKMVVS